MDKEWLHDRFEDDPHSRRIRGQSDTRDRNVDRYAPVEDRTSEAPAKLRVENLHYDLTETDLRELFTRIGPITECQILYDRSDRSRGIAFVTYQSIRDANRAVREFDGANAFGQPIKLALLPSGPAGGRGPRPGLESRINSRSLFDRIGDSNGGARSTRSESPGDRTRARRSDVTRPPPENIDRYVPGSSSRPRPRSRSPLPSRRGGRPPGATRGGRRGRDEKSAGKPRPRKTADELDAEMADYWGSGGAKNDGTTGTGAVGNDTTVMGHGNGTTIDPRGANILLTDDDVDMIE